MFVITFHTVNGHEYKEIEEESEEGYIRWIGSEVKTPNCGWKTDSPNPECNKCCKGCKFTENYLEEIGL